MITFPNVDAAIKANHTSNVAYLATIEENRKAAASAAASAATKVKQEAQTERIERQHCKTERTTRTK